MSAVTTMETINLESNPSQPKAMTKSAKFLIFATGGVGIGLSVVCASFVAPAFRRICLPYVPATSEQVANVLKFLPRNAPSQRLLDIGSGDGRIVIGMLILVMVYVYIILIVLKSGNQSRVREILKYYYIITLYIHFVII